MSDDEAFLSIKAVLSYLWHPQRSRAWKRKDAFRAASRFRERTARSGRPPDVCSCDPR